MPYGSQPAAELMRVRPEKCSWPEVLAAAQFPLRGLEPERQYVFTDADDAAAVVLDGKTLLEQGLPVTVDVPRTAKLWFYRVRE